MSVYDEMRNDIEVLYGGGACGYDVYSDMVDYIDEAETEYDRLVDVLHEVETEAVYAYHCLQQDCATATNSSEHFFKKWWHAECELDRLKKENDKLRELACKYVEYTSEDCCEGCVFKSRCNDSEVDECWQLTEIRGLARELGIEVKE
jgi:hypothetical protein